MCNLKGRVIFNRPCIYSVSCVASYILLTAKCYYKFHDVRYNTLLPVVNGLCITPDKSLLSSYPRAMNPRVVQIVADIYTSYERTS
jgi:hypothetical protein